MAVNIAVLPRDSFDSTAIGTVKRDGQGAKRMIVQCLYVEITFMHQTMVVRTELHKVIKRCSSSVRPMFDVMAVQMPDCTATGEATISGTKMSGEFADTIAKSFGIAHGKTS